MRLVFVVEFNVFEDIHTRLFRIVVVGVLNNLFLGSTEKFHNRVIISVASMTHALAKKETNGHGLESLGCLLATTVYLNE